MSDVRYKRILLKMGGEALAGPGEFGIDPQRAAEVAQVVKDVHDLGVQAALVIGGGNLWRGSVGTQYGMDRTTADHIGMVATVMNALALKDVLERAGVVTRVQTAFAPSPSRTSACAPSATWRRGASSSWPAAPATPISLPTRPARCGRWN